MHDQVAAAVGGLVDMGQSHLDAAEMGARKVTQELVVIAGHIDDAGSLAGLSEQFLHDVVGGLRPVPASSQPPAVDDVADENDGLRLMAAQEGDQIVCFRRLRAEVDIGKKQGS